MAIKFILWSKILAKSKNLYELSILVKTTLGFIISNKEKFCFLLKNKTSIKAVAAYIKNAFTTRENTITQNGNGT